MISLRHAIRCVKQNITPSIRAMSSQSLVNITADKENDEIAILTLQRPPVNSLNLELLQAINNSLDEIVKNNFRAMILTSVSNFLLIIILLYYQKSSHLVTLGIKQVGEISKF